VCFSRFPREGGTFWRVGHVLGWDKRKGWDMPSEYDKERERVRKQSYRERKRLETAGIEPGQTFAERVVSQVEAEVLLSDELRYGADLEQALRDRFGYVSSESRSRAERDGVAARILAGAGGASLTREAYIDRGEALARETFCEQGRRVSVSEGSVTNTLTEKQRVGNARRYAAWRWDGFHRGEVSSL